MALFGGKKKTDTKAEDSSAAVKTKDVNTTKDAATTLVANANIAGVLRNPRITEKSAYAAESNVYVFNIDVRATKEDVRNAIIATYKVTPVKVNVVTIKRKPVKSRKIRKTHYTAGGKKAYVFLKKGETIQIV
jgi:large subunit ribosomal protein L23